MQLSDRTATILMSRTPNENFVLVQECRRQKPEVRINGQESTLPFRLLIPSPLRRISRARPSPCYYNILSAVPSNPAPKTPNRFRKIRGIRGRFYWPRIPQCSPAATKSMNETTDEHR